MLADKVEAYIAVFGFADELKVIAFDDETCTVYLDADLTVAVPRYMVKLDVDIAEEPFIGYTKYGAIAYKEYQNRNEVKTMKTNNKVEVLYKLPSEDSGDKEIYVVSIDGEILYMQVASVSEHKITSGGGGGGGSSSGSGGGDVWTPPAL